jgi:DNA polymerase-3 subunit delta'
VTGLAPLRGHEDVRTALARAVRTGELPGSLLLHGPPGIGKQRLALWLGQLLLCERPGVEPCGECRSCRLSLHLQHPDLHWFFPIERPKGGGSPEKLAEGMEEERARQLEQIREQPLRTPVSDKPIGFFIQQMQTLRRVAASRPAMGSRKVFVIGDAELLVPQESSPDAANVLLKLLEEPPTDTTVLLTASDPDELLPTIRSRLLPIRVRALPEDEVARFLVEQRGITAEAATRVARLAQGSIGHALGFLPDGDEPGPLEKRRADARALLEAAASLRAEARFAAALRVGPAGARGVFSDVLELLAVWVRDLAAVAAGAAETVVNVDALPELEALAARLPDASAAAPRMVRLVEEARTLAHGNVNPQLTLANLLRGLSEALSS